MFSLQYYAAVQRFGVVGGGKRTPFFIISLVKLRFECHIASEKKKKRFWQNGCNAGVAKTEMKMQYNKVTW
jgi:hypothetical protein